MFHISHFEFFGIFYLYSIFYFTILREDTCEPPSELLVFWLFGVFLFYILHFEFIAKKYLVFCISYFAFEYFEEGYLRASFRAAQTPS